MVISKLNKRAKLLYFIKLKFVLLGIIRIGKPMWLIGGKNYSHGSLIIIFLFARINTINKQKISYHNSYLIEYKRSNFQTDNTRATALKISLQDSCNDIIIPSSNLA